VLQNEHSDEYAVPFDADLECKTHVVVYDGNTSSLLDNFSQCYYEIIMFMRLFSLFYGELFHEG